LPNLVSTGRSERRGTYPRYAHWTNISIVSFGGMGWLTRITISPSAEYDPCLSRYSASSQAIATWMSANPSRVFSL
jgi:hypothetical protein